jgi:WD40 repeat protein
VPESKHLITITDDGVISAWEIETGQPRSQMRLQSKVDASISWPGRAWLTVLTEDARVHVLDVLNGSEVRSFLIEKSKDDSIDMEASPDGELALISAGKEFKKRTYSIFDLASGQRLGLWSDAQGVKWSYHGIEIGVQLANDRLLIHDLRTQRDLQKLDFTGDELKGFEFSPFEKLVLVKLSNRVEVYSYEGKVERVLSFKATDVLFGGRRRLVLSFPDQTARLVEVPSDRILRYFDARDLGWEVQFSKDGRFALSNGGGGPSLWDTSTWTKVQSFGNHESRVDFIWIGTDGRVSVTYTKGDVVRIWPLGEVASMAPAERRDAICHAHLLGNGAFSDEEMLDAVLFGRNDLKTPCAQVGPLRFSYWSNLANGLWHFIQPSPGL